MRGTLTGFVLALLASLPAWGQVTWRGYAAGDYRYFTQDALGPDQRNGYASFVVQPELRMDWGGGRQSLTVTPFYRWDQHDNQRRHADMRELFWLYVGDGFETRVGLRKVFWGVTESQHLVDVINQTDLVESPDGEDKLGQPMASAKLFSTLGTWEMFVLPYFRERTFPGQAGRLRTQPRIDTEGDALYEHRRKKRHVDYALRWSRTLGAWDIGLSQFYGTNREPRLVQSTDTKGEPVLRPLYELMHQTGLDVQATLQSWLLKLEVIRRASNADVYRAATAGVEYTLYGVFGGPTDVGLVAEYLYDSRRENALTPFQDDLMLGLRLTPNDSQSTEFLLGVIADRRTSARVYTLEASRRLSDHVRLGVEARAFSGFASEDPLYPYRRDDYIQLELTYYF